MGENLKLIVGMLKCQLHKATMTKTQIELYDAVSKTMTFDRQKHERTVVLPATAESKDLKKVKRQLELEGGDGACGTINFVTDGNSKGSCPGIKHDPKP